MRELCKFALISPAIKYNTGYLTLRIVRTTGEMCCTGFEHYYFRSLVQIGGKVVTFPLMVNYPFLFYPA